MTREQQRQAKAQREAIKQAERERVKQLKRELKSWEDMKRRAIAKGAWIAE